MSTPEDDKFTKLIDALNTVVERQNRLEERLALLEGKPKVDLPKVNLPKPVELVAPPVFTPEIYVSETVDALPVPEKAAIESRLGLTIINRIGVVTLVLGVAFFFNWAVDNNWIGPAGRVMLGLLAGFATLAVADVLWRKGQQIFAQGITGTGIAIVYLSFYAAFDFYHLIPQTTAFILLLATTAMAATLALRYNAIAIAALGFFGAYLVPLLLSNGEDHPWFLMTYLLLLNVAANALAKRRKWVPLEVLSFVATMLIVGSWLFSHGESPQDRWPATLGLVAFGAQRFRTALPVLFLLSQVLTTLSLAFVWEASAARFWGLAFILLALLAALAFSHYRKYPAIVATAFSGFWLAVSFCAHYPAAFVPTDSIGFLVFAGWTWWRFAMLDEQPTVRGFAVFALNGVFYYGLAFSVLNPNYHHWLGLLAVVVAASYLAFGMLIYRRKQSLDLDIVVLALGVSVAFLTLAIPIQFAGFSISLAWSIQAATLTWIGVRLQNSKAILSGLAVFALALWHAAAIDSLRYLDPHSYSVILNMRFLVFAVLAVALLLSASWTAKLERKLALVPFVAGHVVMLAGLSLEVVGWAQRSSETANEWSRETLGITILFAVYSVMLVSVGVARRSKASRLAGLALTAIVIAKLYLYDVWQLGRVYQIVAFVILGILLLSTSFLYSRFKGLIQEWAQDEKTGL